ncbi:bifunctional ADP-dependent NAD(P)H-hydrate dehydratase/NAD(P)H-hydrate epimerase [Wenxinia marina]|uniref:Bifunctional NAD(P)H-hydrate repair enzyme n=1 Tax=Wenxinia marina DSM 24838 TaxID=1123501 RepID=A0A0D0QD76_9RHOB|nr:bifunctional ADP-dependent NAD(P)H-hydrate dehydratase/NAD(P)H-hydrate epimerase [Wenxinia marina]KIQ68958.1 yjeF, hydroxyethylthiazole kinase-related protein [Wenxinia marina DSM 24838]GGL63770.1 bifunctional NAD(P)H-hydrate repair enzyme [Wenxinia marina]
MTTLMTAAEMRAAERAASDRGDATGLELMERAGQGVVNAILSAWPELAEGVPHAVVLCGPGNNGGDGFVVARLLKERGWEVEVCFFGDADRQPPDARKNATRWSAQGPIGSLSQAGEGMRPALLVDALFGIGLSRPIPLECAEAFHAVRERSGAEPCRVVAIDVPSGMDADSGAWLHPDLPDLLDEALDTPDFFWREIASRTLPCDLCVTFHRGKVGHWLAGDDLGPRRPVIVDIGLGDRDGPETVRLVAPAPDAPVEELRDWLQVAAFPHVGGGQHKYDRGHVLVLGGGPGHGGAGRLAARAALRIGAGLVTLGVPAKAMAENAAQLTSIMLREIGDANALRKVLEDDRLRAVCLGPGLGIGAGTRKLVAAALAGPDDDERRRAVLDADALTSFADDPDALFALLHPNAVLTPHEGEFARLFPDLSETARRDTSAAPSLSKVEAARTAARRAGCTVLLKGQATVIASPDGTASISAAMYDRAAPWLGTAGAGDVLAGMIAGLLGAEAAPYQLHRMVEAAAYLHVECARAFGPGLISEDLPEALPGVLRRIGL